MHKYTYVMDTVGSAKSHIYMWTENSVVLYFEQAIADQYKVPFWEQPLSMWDTVNNVGLRYLN